jgi:hypothetical protein
MRLPSAKTTVIQTAERSRANRIEDMIESRRIGQMVEPRRIELGIFTPNQVDLKLEKQ